MSTIQWVIMYLCVAALVGAAAIALAAWSRGRETPTRHITVGPAVVAGAVWPLLLVGALQWLLVHGLAKTMRPQPERTSDAIYYGPLPSTSRSPVDVG